MPARRLSLPLLFGLATAFGLSSSIQSYLLSATTGEQMGLLGSLHLVTLNLVYWYVPALLAPFIMGIASRYQFGRGLGWQPFAVHFGGALLYSVAHSVAMLATRIVLMQQNRPSRGWWMGVSIRMGSPPLRASPI